MCIDIKSTPSVQNFQPTGALVVLRTGDGKRAMIMGFPQDTQFPIISCRFALVGAT